MRYHDIINEIDRIGDIEPGNIIAKPRHIDVEDLLHDSKKLPGNNPYRYSIQKNRDDYTIYMIDSGEISDNEIIGKLVIEPISFPLNNAGLVDYITVHKHYTGTGVAKSLYGIVLSILKRPLIAGSLQTPGGRRNWVSLNRIPGVQVKGYIKISDDNIELQDEGEWQETVDSIMNTGADYIGKDRYDDHYFAFDVENNSDLAELQAVYKRAVHLYHDDWQSLHTGLYAVWTGK